MKEFEDLTEPELRRLCNAVGADIEDTFRDFGINGKPKFVVLLFNDPKVGQYVSNCNRTDMIACLHETVDRLVRRQDVRRGG